VISLLLTPPEDIALSEFNGFVLLSAPGVVAPELAVPFSFRAVSDAIGDLRVETVDEFFYFAEGAPRLTNATVRLLDPFNGTELTNAVSDATGFATLSGVREGYYQLRVTADKHQAYSDVIFVDSAQLNEELAFLQRETVSYNWIVEEIEIEDRTRITIESTFETVVPVPVLVLENGILDLNDLVAVGQSKQIDMTIRNEGLINAINVRFQFPNSPDYDISPLIENIGVMPPLSSLTVPVTVTRLTPLGARQAREQAKAAGDKSGDKSLACAAACLAWAYICGPFNVGKCTSIPIINDDGRNCTASPVFGGGGGGGGFSFSGTPVGFSSPFECDCEEIEFCLGVPGDASSLLSGAAGALSKLTENTPIILSDPELKLNAEVCLKRCCEDKKATGWKITANGDVTLSASATYGLSREAELPFPNGKVAGNVRAGLFGDFEAGGSICYESPCNPEDEGKFCVEATGQATIGAGAEGGGTAEVSLPNGVSFSAGASFEGTVKSGVSGNIKWCRGEGVSGQACFDGVTGTLQACYEEPGITIEAGIASIDPNIGGSKKQVGGSIMFIEQSCAGFGGAGRAGLGGDKGLDPGGTETNLSPLLNFDEVAVSQQEFDIDAGHLAGELGYSSLRNMQDAATSNAACRPPKASAPA